MEIIYRALDGTIFKSEKECISYEKDRKLTAQKMGIYLNDCKVPISVFDPGFYEEVKYIYLPTDEAVALLRSVSDGYCFPEEKGFWAFNWDDNEWLRIDEEIKNLQEKITHYQEIIDSLKAE